LERLRKSTGTED